MKDASTHEVGGVAADKLQRFVERIERLEEEKAGIASDIKDIYAEAKSDGFDTKAIREIIRLRKMAPHERRAREATLDIYKAALGMLEDTPLGQAAIERLTKKRRPPEDEDDDRQTDIEDYADAATGPTAEQVDEARRDGGEAARAGQPVTANPYPAGDKRRAAWDEGWCQALGSTGMEIPDSLRRRKPARRKAEQAGDDAR